MLKAVTPISRILSRSVAYGLIITVMYGHGNKYKFHIPAGAFEIRYHTKTKPFYV